jgi:hypothetical protein
VVEELVDFLQMGFQQKPAAPWLDIGKRNRSPSSFEDSLSLSLDE